MKSVRKDREKILQYMKDTIQERCFIQLFGKSVPHWISNPPLRF